MVLNRNFNLRTSVEELRPKEIEKEVHLDHTLFGSRILFEIDLLTWVTCRLISRATQDSGIERNG